MTVYELTEIVEELVKATDQLTTILEQTADVMYLQTLNIRFLIDRVEDLERKGS